MAEKTMLITQQQTKPIKILKWKISEGNTVSIGRIMLLYDFDGVEKPEQRKLKLTQAGKVRKIVVQEGAIIKPGEILCELEECRHPTIMNDMCADCGTDLRQNDESTTASVPMVHAIPDLKVSEELAQKLGKADTDRLIKDRKLVLLVDLDQTLIHTTNDNIAPNIKDVHHFQLYGPNSQWYHTRLRPGTHQFLDNMFPFYELHICTFGARNYAHTVATYLDPSQKFFSNRILSRDECFDPTSKKANLKALFPCGDNMVCIIDDREDVWSNASNLIHVKPYHFFKHTGDINAPPGLDKQENDDKLGVDLSNIQNNKKISELDKRIEENGGTIDGNSKKTDVISEEIDETLKKIDEHSAETDENSKKIEEASQKINKHSEEINENSKKIEEITCDTPKDKESINVDNKEHVEIKTNGEHRKVEKINGSDGQIPTNDDQKAVEQEESEIVDKNKQSESVVNPAKPECHAKDSLIEVEDPDDYLLHLEDILKRIHKAFYEAYDRMESGDVPDLKKVIPDVRNHVLKNCKLVFSGLVPTHVKLEQSKAYQIARSLGATITQDLDDNSTHLVAVRPGTAKVNAGRRRKNLKIITPDWLWCCAERWEHVSEEIFPLNSKGSKNRHPPPHCSSPDHTANYPEHNTPAAIRKRTPSGRFMDTINPLMSFSQDDIADMDKEVEDILDDESESSDDESKIPNTTTQPTNLQQLDEDSNSNSNNSISSISSRNSDDNSISDDIPKRHKRKRQNDNVNSDLKNNTANDDDELPSAKFRRGESVDDELDVEPSTDESNDSYGAPDEGDDGEWNMMGAALEREFLSNN